MDALHGNMNYFGRHLWDHEMLSLSIKLYFLPGFKLVCILLQTKGWRSRSERYIIKMYEAKTLQNRITWLGEVGAGSRECLMVRKLWAHALTKDILFKQLKNTPCCSRHRASYETRGTDTEHLGSKTSGCCTLPVYAHYIQRYLIFPFR